MQSSKWRNLARAASCGGRWLALWLAARPAWAQPAAPGALPGAASAPDAAAPAPSPSAASPAPAAPPSSAGPGEALEQAHLAFQRGNALRESGDLPGALREFERAYELSPAFQVLYYVGALNVELQQWARARQAFELYLQLGAGQLGPERIAEVQLHLEELSKHTATLTLTLNVAGADVQVDGAKLSATTISGLILDSGEHVVRVSKPGFQPLEQVVRANVGENLHLVLPLAPLAPSDAPALTARAPSAAPGAAPSSAVLAPHDQNGTPWLPWAITGALGVGWATTAALAIQARHDRDRIERPGTSDARIDSARQLHMTLAVVSDVLLAATLASAGVSAYLTWWSEPAQGATGNASSAGSPAPHGSLPTGFSAGFSGRF
ncbi:MAG TPA: PEGA domain-containing protein [Polyangiaceae bacterium]|nr:PEGA domain-containing protein [Polyangiaceae bacterium]